MKKRKIVLSVTLVLAILLTIIPMSFLATAEGEIEISSYVDLQKIGNDSGYRLNGSYKLIDNITVGEAEEAFIPIGTQTSPFTGVFDGGKYQISGIKITGTNEGAVSDVGLFGYVGTGASISNLKISNAQFVNIDAGQVKTIGFIAGYNKGTIENCAAVKSKNSIELDGSKAVVGGIVGDNKGSISKCYNTSDMSVQILSLLTSLQLGGISGDNDTNAKIEDCFNTGTVNVKSDNPFIPFGGISGTNKGEINRTYNIGVVKGMANVGGIVGKQEESATVTNSYYHEETALLQYGNMGNTDLKLTNSQMCILSNFKNFSANGWSIEAGYPYPQLTYMGAVSFEDFDVDSVNFAGGNGRIYDPYQISSTAQLNNIRNNMSACYKLTSDILFLDWDFKDSAANQEYIITGNFETLGELFTELFAGKTLEEYIAENIGFQGAFHNAGASWIPLGVTTQIEDGQPVVSVEPFVGIFYGNNKTIYNLQSNAGGQGSVYSGLFALNSGIIKDFTIADKPTAEDANTLITNDVLKALFVEGSDVSGVTGSSFIATSDGGDAYAGSIAAQNEMIGLISDVKNESKVKSVAQKAITGSKQYKAYSGGITASNQGIISNASNFGEIKAYSKSLHSVAGGIVGFNKGGYIRTATNTGLVYTSYYLSESETLVDIGFNTIMDKAYLASGGIVGESLKRTNDETEIKLIDNAKNLGGVMTQIISNSATDKFYAGGIVGNGLGAIDETNCYYWEKTAKYAVATKPAEYEANKKALSYIKFSGIAVSDENCFLNFEVPEPPSDGYTIDNYQTHLDEHIGTGSAKLYNNSETEISIDVSKSYTPSSNYVLINFVATETDVSKASAGRAQALSASADFFIKFASPGEVTSSTYEVEDIAVGGENKKIINNVSTKTTVEQFRANVNEGEFIQVYKNGVSQSDTATIGTGFVVKLMDGETVKQELTIVIKGDIAGGGSVGVGDGRISVLDLAKLKEHILQRTTLTGIAFIASDMNTSDSISTLDYAMLKDRYLHP